MTKEGGNMSGDLWDFIVPQRNAEQNRLHHLASLCVNFLFRVFSLLIKFND